jgi:lipid-A-disaccharide synthase
MEPKRVFIICGEASGDLHAANLVTQWRAQNNDFEFCAWGGNKLEALGVPILKDIKTLSFMGFLEVIMNLRTILRNIKLCKQQITEFRADAVVLVDFPGFNLRIAKWAKANHIKVIYYISPQIWAWKEGRVKKIKECVDHMFCILPFESEFYAKHGMLVHYEGHPLLDEIVNFRSQNRTPLQFDKPVLAILPGSRMQEVKRKLPVMLAAAQHFPEYQIVVACSSQIDLEFFEKFQDESIAFIYHKTYDILNISELALVTSGTATLETALFEVPQVVCYKSSNFSYQIAKRLIKVKYISLVNLIMNQALVCELIQEECNESRMAFELNALKRGDMGREKVASGYKALISALGNSGASKRIASKMIETFYSGHQ